MLRTQIRPTRRSVDVLGDLGLLAWLVIWGFVAKAVADLVRGLAAPASSAASKTEAIARRIEDAGREVANAPVVGDLLAKPFKSLAEGLSSLAGGTAEQAEMIQTVGTVLFWVIWAIPVLTLAWNYLPWRISRAFEARGARRFIDEQADLDLFALRAMANAPMTKIAQISADPVAAWRAGDRAVIDALANLELRRVGIGVSDDS